MWTIFVIALAIILLGLAIAAVVHGDTIMNVLAFLMIAYAIIGTFLWIIPNAIIRDFSQGDLIKKSHYNIVSVRNESQIEGSFGSAFTIGQGWIGNTEYYLVMQQYPDGRMIRRKLRASETFIIESNEIPPSLHWEVWGQGKGWFAWWYTNHEYRNDTLYVPEGTVIHRFIID